MGIDSKIRVLIVDDNHLFHEVVVRGISSDQYIEVVAKASDPFEARGKILAYKPNVIICNVEMIKMNGIEYMRRLLQYPLPVIVVSSAKVAVFVSMSIGTIDFISKPDEGSPKDMEKFVGEMIAKIKHRYQKNSIQYY